MKEFLTIATDKALQLNFEYEVDLRTIRANIDHPKTQDQVRLMFAAFCEELAELSEAIQNGRPQNILDELHDVYNFGVVLSSALMGEPDMYVASLESVESNPNNSPVKVAHELMEVQKNFGMAMNLLKNRPWKKSNYRTDPAELKEQSQKALRSLIDFLMLFPFDEGTFIRGFGEKYKTNIFRIKSNY